LGYTGNKLSGPQVFTGTLQLRPLPARIGENILRRIFILLSLCFTVFVLLTGAVAPFGAARAQDAAGDQATYVVQPGDNLYRIGLRFNIPTGTLAAYNGIINPNLIYVGQVIRIPPGGVVVPTATPIPGTRPPATIPPATQPPSGTSTYIVQPGDTLSRIAARFGTTVQALVQTNGILNPNLIFAGQSLIVPGGTGIITPTPTVPPGVTVTAPPPATGGNFETGGQIQELNSGTQNAIRTAKMTWIKRQLKAGDDAAGPINQAHGAGFKILLSIIGDKAQVTNAAYADTYANYVRSAAQAGADAIEVWNEQNLDREWPANQINATTYTNLLAKAYAAIKSVNPNTVVISGAPAPTGAEGAFPGRVVNDDRYYAAMSAAGAARYLDCVGVHYNEGIVAPNRTTGDPRDNYPTRYFITMLNRALASFPGKKACFTEIGYLTREGYGPLPANFSWAGNTTVAQQAAWIAQAAQIAKSQGRVQLFIVFNVDLSYYGPDDPQAGYALIRPGGSCPGCTTLGALP
jgi:LysM repeat protein